MDRRLAACAIGALALGGCGGQKGQDAAEPSGDFTVEVVRASFPTQQRLAQRSEMEIVVRNAGNQTVPNVAVSVQAAPGGETGQSSGETSQVTQAGSAEAFAEIDRRPGLANPSRPVWILDSGPRGGVTAYTNTWALGALRPQQERSFLWRLTAVKSGVHTIRYTVSAGLNGKAKARLSDGSRPVGEFTVDISRRPAEGRLGAGDRPEVVPR